MTAASPPVNVGIVGLGWPGEQHAKALGACTDARLAAGCDLDAVRRSKFVATFQPPKVFADFDAMLADPEIDAVAVCLPNFLHFPATMAALQAGKHVLCEKPPTMNAPEMMAIKAEADTRGLIYFFSRQMRFEGAMLAAKQIIASGRLGTIYLGKTFFSRARGIPIGIDAWFVNKAKAGGGAMIDLGVHALDSVWYLMGCPRPESVSAKVFSNFRSLVPPGVSIDVEDAGYGFLKFANGAVIMLDVSWAGNLPDDIPPHPESFRELRNSIIYGDKASLRLSPFTLFEDQAGRLVDVPLETDKASGFIPQMQNFVDAVLGRAEPVNNAQQAVYLMEMLDAIYTSSETGREVVLTD